MEKYEISPERLEEILFNASNGHRHFNVDVHNVSSDHYGVEYTIKVKVDHNWAPLTAPLPLFDYLKDGNTKV